MNAQEHDARFVRAHEVTNRIGVSRSTLYNWIAAKKFPAPIRIGDNTSAWLERDISEWIARRVATSRLSASRPRT